MEAVEAELTKNLLSATTLRSDRHFLRVYPREREFSGRNLCRSFAKNKAHLEVKLPRIIHDRDEMAAFEARTMTFRGAGMGFERQIEKDTNTPKGALRTSWSVVAATSRHDEKKFRPMREKQK
jgi:hypothetical protein